MFVPIHRTHNTSYAKYRPLNVVQVFQLLKHSCRILITISLSNKNINGPLLLQRYIQYKSRENSLIAFSLIKHDLVGSQLPKLGFPSNGQFTKIAEKQIWNDPTW